MVRQQNFVFIQKLSQVATAVAKGENMSEKSKKIGNVVVKIFWGAVWTLLGLLALLVLWLAFDKFILKNPVPSVFGYSSLNIATGSMNGNSALVAGHDPKQVSEGDLIVIKNTGDYEIGDVVTFLLDGDTIPTTHRIVGITEEGFITKGDANNTKDLLPVPQDKIFGEVVGHYPTLGAFSMWLKAEGWIYVVAALAVLALGGFLIKEVGATPATEQESVEQAENQQATFEQVKSPVQVELEQVESSSEQQNDASQDSLQNK